MNTILLTARKALKVFAATGSILIIQALFYQPASYGQLVVQGGFTPAQLVDSLLGAGVTVSNITYTGTPTASGLFNGTASNIGLGQGILLTSGDIMNAPGPNISPSTGTDNFLPGDPDLDALIGSASQDACVLEFDFTVPTDTVKFRYVFGSEEYSEFVCSNYNDVFGFFISGPGISGIQNLALVPGTSNPVSINNVNGGVSAGTAPCILTNTAYYINNETPPGQTVEYDGFLVVLQAEAAVIPCETYHIKIAIADVFDGAYDSGVFLEQGSFSGVSTTAAATANPNIACAPATINFTNNSVGGALFAWNFDDGSPVDSSMNPVHVFTTPGVYNVQLIATGALACGGISDTTYVTVTITTNLPVNLGPDTSLCAGTSIILGWGIISGTSYLWSTGDTTSSIVVTTPGTYYVNVTSALCPAGSDTINVTLTTVDVDLGNDTTLCGGQSYTITSNITGTNYQWSTGNTTSSLTVNTSGTYWVVVTANGCQGVDSVTVTFINPASVNLGNDTTICSGQPVTLGGNLSGTIFLWSTGQTTSTITVSQSGTYWVNAGPPGCQGSDTIVVNISLVSANLGNDTTICTGQSVVLGNTLAGNSFLWSTGATTSTISVSNSGTYTVTVTDGGCMGTDSINVIITPPPVIALGNDTTLCSGNTLTLNAGTHSSYIWSTGNTTSTINVTTSGTYYVNVSDGGCFGADSINVNFTPLPVVNLGSNLSFCSGLTDTLDAGNAGATYLWSNGNTTQTVIVNSSGTYTVTVTMAGCSASGSVLVTVNSLPVIVLSNDVAICTGNSTNLSASGGVNYSWTPSNGLSSTTISNPVANPTSTTTYTVTVTDANSCSASKSVTVTVNALPVITTIADTVICEGNSVSLTTQGGVSYSWTPVNDLDNPTSSSPVASPLVPTTYTVIGIDANGCQNSDNVSIGISDAPTASFTSDFEISCKGTIGIFTNTSSNASQYLWDFGDGATSTDMSPVHDFSVGVSGTITLTAFNAGCSHEVTIPIPDPLTLKTNVPNIFTPNGDYFNNCFGLDSLNGFESCFSIEIFNRWGNSVYQSDNAHGCWDGTTKDKEAPAGVYFYLLKIANNEFKGTIELVR
ncbi:MAG TPA: choice-of-anchor L domain-containing protein [Bacteroidia bacterium]|nr:choice-of-anchor L domain-containing protein [Bacteroidia bacterium]